MGLDLLPITGHGHVHEVLLVPQVLEGGLDALLEVVPAKTELIAVRGSHLGYPECWLTVFRGLIRSEIN